MLDNHLTILIKSICSIRNYCSVCKFNTCSIIYVEAFASCSKSYTCKTGTNSEIVVITVNTVKTKLRYAILTVVKISINPIQTVRRRIVPIERTVFTEVMPYGIGVGVVLDKANTCIHISVSGKVILFTINCSICTRIVFRTIAISGTGRIYYPCALGNTIFIKDILDSANGLFTNIELIIGTCIAVTFISSLPTGLEDIVNRIVEITIHLKNAGTGHVYFEAIFAVMLSHTNELTVIDLILMIDNDLIGDGSPINYRLTSLAIGSVHITCFFQGCFLVENGKLCIVIMPRIIVYIKVGYM